jgi:hypothetical protein
VTVSSGDNKIEVDAMPTGLRLHVLMQELCNKKMPNIHGVQTMEYGDI